MAKIVKNSLGNSFFIFVIFSLVTGWFYSGFLRIWQKPPIPPEEFKKLEIFGIIKLDS